MKRICIAGASECGKTTLAIELSRAYWRNHKMPSLVLDIWKAENSWGKQAWVTADEKKFFGTEENQYADGAIWKRRGDLVIVDEASTVIARDRNLVPIFTRIRHCEHTLLVICHDATDLLPTMRRNLNELFLFCQPVKAIPLWQQDLPTMRGMEKATNLDKYFFLHCKNFSEATPKKLKL